MEEMDLSVDHVPEEEKTAGDASEGSRATAKGFGAKESPNRAKLELELHSIGRSHKVAIRRTSMARVSSFQTRTRMQRELTQSRTTKSVKRCEVAERLLTVFRRFEDDIVQQYFWSRDFAQDFLCLCEYAKGAMRNEPKLFTLRGPVHVFGDIHGNIEDLFFFRDKLWPTGMELTAGKFLFLGDYVDRGMNGLEVLTYLFSSKVCAPHKLFMLRGNHELRYVNGWEQHYRERSFLWQCKDRFGQRLGEKVWRAANAVFDCLPLACVIDESVFCSHGGIPRQRGAPSLPSNGSDPCESESANDSEEGAQGIFDFSQRDQEGKSPEEDTRLADIASMPSIMKITPMRLGPEEDEDEDEEMAIAVALKAPELEPWQTSLAMDLLWGDPCPSNGLAAANGTSAKQESPHLDASGFGPGQRGGAAIMFGQRAVDEFFASNGFTIMLRAHQASAAGVAVSKNGKVVTVFSTSKDHALGDKSTCAYMLVEDSKVIAVNRIVEDPVRMPKQRTRVRVSANAGGTLSENDSSAGNGLDEEADARTSESPSSTASGKRGNKRSVNVFPLAAKIMSKTTTMSQAA
ncbi:Serine/threonine-protein phosphatase [Hondaea fermentalgiana]|uniref:Serine/threonine-protein phosphatase n=1 Tax=Hondaea fermentalgiana TaxID=2315210 RepID=A0A2R5GBY7_9STRA|nr:Serine/threonine-protein phosphatase [Hondaea fermentalgiana]|eukprot:GBG25641.1 Serine/threonine-protein phosphatase [Hondaea fermentalgiana]